MNIRGIFLLEYRKDVRDFIEFVRHKTDSASRIKYLCKRYINMVYRHITLVEEYLLRYGICKKYTYWIWYGEDDPNEVVRDDDDTEDDSDAAEPIKYGGIEKLLDDLHQGACLNIRMSTTASESNSDHEHNIRLEVEGTYE